MIIASVICDQWLTRCYCIILRSPLCFLWIEQAICYGIIEWFFGIAVNQLIADHLFPPQISNVLKFVRRSLGGHLHMENIDEDERNEMNSNSIKFQFPPQLASASSAFLNYWIGKVSHVDLFTQFREKKRREKKKTFAWRFFINFIGAPSPLPPSRYPTHIVLKRKIFATKSRQYWN